MALKRKLDKQWKDWLRTNLASGCDKNGLFKILLDNGFDYKTIRKQMKFEPQVPVSTLRNPLTDPARQSRVGLKPQKQEPLDWSRLYIANASLSTIGPCSLQQLDGFLNNQEQTAVLEQMQAELTLLEEAPGADASGAVDLGAHVERAEGAIRALDQRINRLLGFHPSYADQLRALRLPVGAALPLTHDNKRQPAHTVAIVLSGTQAVQLKLDDLADSVDAPECSLTVCSYPASETDNPLTHQPLQCQTQSDQPTLVLLKNFYRTSNLNAAPSMYTKEANEYIHSYTHTGFVKTVLPEALFSKIKNFYEQNRSKHATETIAGGYVFNAADQNKKSSTLVHLPEGLKKEIHDTIVPMVSEWCNKELEPSYVYGIRVYRDQAVLKLHRDRIETHVLGVIINVDQEVRDDWPLMIDDHSYRQHQILLKPGEMIFYESARLRHGRPQPFNGTSFANIFCHLRPTDYILRK